MYQRQLTFSEAVKKALTENYCNFSGRASRSEFWWFQLFYIIVCWGIGIIDLIVFGRQVLYYIVALLLFLPGLGLAVRRLHDTGKSGWLVLLNFVICVGSIILLVFYAKESDMFPNEYGDVPYTDNNNNNYNNNNNQTTQNNNVPTQNNQW